MVTVSTNPPYHVIGYQSTHTNINVSLFEVCFNIVVCHLLEIDQWKQAETRTHDIIDHQQQLPVTKGPKIHRHVLNQNN